MFFAPFFGISEASNKLIVVFLSGFRVLLGLLVNLGG